MAGTETMYHGGHRGFSLHLGLCLTDDETAARRYGRGGQVATLSVDLAGLRVLDVGGYDREENEAPGDDGDARGADVLVYDDEDEYGQWHRTWRIMTHAALAAVSVVSVERA